MKFWKFHKTDMLQDFRFDPILRRFYEYGIVGLVRENIQNSLDARFSNGDPCIVRIQTGTLSTKDIPGAHEIFDHVKALQPANEYSKEAVEHMNDHLGKDRYRYMSFEDENTKGLDGAYDDVESRKESSYYAYAYSKGMHHYEKDEEIEEIRGGSHGVGKIASNSASIFNAMFFSNCDKNGLKTIGGTVELMEHELNKEKLRATGHFGKNEGDEVYPYGIEELSSLDVFKKDTRGLKLIIPFLEDAFDDQDEIIRTVCDSFLKALIDEKLVVFVNENEINSDTLQDFITDEHYFEQELSEIKDRFALLYWHTLSKDPLIEDFKVSNKDKWFHFKLHFVLDNEISEGRTGVFRSIGMKIEDMKIKNNVRKPYNAVLIPHSSKEDKYLKSLENESHTKIDYEHINKKWNRQKAKYFINELNRKMGEIIEEHMMKDDPMDGIMDTRDILYTIENEFKSDLKRKLSPLNIGKGKSKKKIVKTQDTDEPGRSQRNKKGKHRKQEHYKPVKKQFGNEGKKTYYQFRNSAVRRTVLENKERLYIKVGTLPYPTYENDKISSGNILVSLVDGMGKEYYDEIDLRAEYREVEDRNQIKKLTVDKHVIKGVDLSNGDIHLDIKLRNAEATIKNVKLRYYLEV